jgi:BirA family biotin operon repressor/biotin-[acetyl-CoA-carboxylase] ligase
MPSCHSTNDISAELLSKGDIVDGTVVITDHQHKGRGQGSNTWESERGSNLTLSIILRTDFLKVADQFYLSMMTSLAIADFLDEYTQSGVSIKWPNDIFYQDKKICGILIQNVLKGSQLEHSILGMGININQEYFLTENAVSLHNITGRWYDLEKMLSSLSGFIEYYYELLNSGKYEQLKSKYMNRLRWLNEVRSFQADRLFSGKIIDIDRTGRLMIQVNGSVHSFDFKEVTFVE